MRNRDSYRQSTRAFILMASMLGWALFDCRSSLLTKIALKSMSLSASVLEASGHSASFFVIKSYTLRDLCSPAAPFSTWSLNPSMNFFVRADLAFELS